MKSSKTLGKKLVLTVATAFLLVGCSPSADNTGQATQKEIPVQVASVRQGELELEREISGKLKAKTEISVLPKTAGQIMEINVKKGDKVTKGQTLAKLDVRDLTTALNLEKTALEQAKNQLETAKISERVAANNLENAKANLVAVDNPATQAGQSTTTTSMENFRIQYEDAKKNRERMAALYEVGAISLADYEKAVSQEKMAELSLKNGEIGSKQTSLAVANAEENLAQAKNSVKQAQISLQQTELRVKQAQDRVTDGFIKAPESGEIASLNGKKGELTSNQAPFAAIVSADIITFEAQVSAEQLKLFSQGEEVTVKISSLNQERQATITFISPAANQGGLYTLEAVIDNSDRKLKAGLVATLITQEIKAADAVIIPTEAIVEKEGTTFVYVVKANKAARQEVEVLQSQTKESAIKGAVAASDQIVVKGQNTLDDGSLVTIVKGAQ